MKKKIIVKKNMTPREIVHSLKKKGLRACEIIKQTNLTRPTVYKYYRETDIPTQYTLNGKSVSEDVHQTKKILDVGEKADLFEEERIQEYAKEKTKKEAPDIHGKLSCKHLSTLEKSISMWGWNNIANLCTIIMEKALEGDMEAAKIILNRTLPIQKPDRKLRTSINNFIKIGVLQDYEKNIAMVSEKMARGELDLEDGQILIDVLVKGKEFKSSLMIDDMESKLTELKKEMGKK